MRKEITIFVEIHAMKISTKHYLGNVIFAHIQLENSKKMIIRTDYNIAVVCRYIGTFMIKLKLYTCIALWIQA
jgi:hypothetical protein